MTQPPPFPYEQNTLIRASAGSGKTHALSSQFIALLYQGASPSSILATTFTRKAAGEILGKVLIRLAHAATSKSKAKELGEFFKVPGLDCAKSLGMLQAVCKELHRVSVSTLDAFFSRLAGSFRLELDLPLDPSMVSSTDPQAVRARAEGIEAMLASSEPAIIVDMLKRVHHDHVNRSVTGAIDMIVSQLHELYRTSPDSHTWSRLKIPDTLSDDLLAIVIEQLQTLLKGDLPSRYPATLQKSLELAQRGDWDAFLKVGIPKLLAEDKTQYYKKPIPQDVTDVVYPLFVHAKADRIARIAKQTIATWELLHAFDQQYDTIRRSRRLLTFSDLPLKLAREISPLSDINSPGLDAIYYRLDGQVQHLLLDEFQDTSPLQWQVLMPIAQEIVNHMDQDRSFFCVGDVKQSIYSWRGGCAELFDKLTNDLALPDKSKRSLDKSYRTSQDVLDVINNIFNNLLNCEPVLQSNSMATKPVVQAFHADFKSHTAALHMPGYVKLVTSNNDPFTNSAVDDGDKPYDSHDSQDQWENELDAQIDGDNDADTTTADPHAQYVATYITDLARTHPKREIGVLVRTNRMVSQLIHLLQKQGVNASGEGGNPVTDDPAVELILAAMQLADHPGDSVARYHVQRSPLAHVIHLPETSPQALEAFSHQVRDSIAKQGFAAAVHHWTTQLALHGNERSATRLGQLVELAQDFDQQPSTRPSEFVDFVKATPVEEPVRATVRVMTIHKSKGLEFDIVVLPELHAKMGQVSRQLAMVYRNNPTEEPAAIFRYANKETRLLSPELQDAYHQEEERRLSDDLCAMYVALTRPKQALHMIIPPLGLTTTGNLKSAGRTDLSPASILRNLLSENDDEQVDIAQELFSQGQENWDLQAVPPDAQQERQTQRGTSDKPLPAGLLKLNLPRTGDPSRSWRVIAPSSLEADQSVRVQDLLRMVPADGRTYGSLMHAMFQQIHWLTPNTPLPDAQLKDIFQIAKRQTPQATQAQQASAQQAFTRMLTEPAIVKALAQPSPTSDRKQVELWRERPFAVRLEGALVNGILDRVMIQLDAHGKALNATIVDYKTDRLPQDQHPTAGVATIAARYRPQMIAYRKAMASMLGLAFDDIDAHLLLLGTGQMVKIV